MSNNKNISWKAPEYKHYEKTAGWYVTLIAITILLAAFFVIVQKDIFGAVCFSILALLIIFFSLLKPEEVEIELSEKAVRFGNLLYPYKQIKHFWVVDNQRHKALLLQTTTFINNILVLELTDQDSEQIRNFLLQYLPEHEQTHETFAQKVMHWFKF